MRPRRAALLGALIGLGLLGGVPRLGPATALAAVSGAPCPTSTAHPWCDRDLGPNRRAGLLLGAMTEQERIGLLGGDDIGGIGGGENLHTGTGAGVPRLGIPTVHYSDGPQGARQGPVTALPSPEALAASWDPELAREYGRVVGNEVFLKGNDAVFGPTVDIVRVPLAGRTYEDYGEDPLLSAQTAVGWISGAQSQRVMATVKHFVLNNQEGYSPLANQSAPGKLPGPPPTEGNRMLVDAEVSQRALHEIYLPMFEAAVTHGHVALVMCAYNRVNGSHACESSPLLTDVLRRQFGFAGAVVADYLAAHHTGPGLASGLDFEPWPGIVLGSAAVNLALATGQATVAEVDLHVRRMLRTMFAFGLFDRVPPTNVDRRIDHAAHAAVAERVEESGITLLRNPRGLLPLRRSGLRRVAVIGADAARFVTGGGSGSVTPYAFNSPLAALRERLGSRVRVTYDDGRDVAQAVADARAAGVAVVFAGDYDTEGTDRACLTLECPLAQGDQDGLIAALAAAQPHNVVVLETGGPVLTPWRYRVGALLEAWYPGGQAGPAIARVLLGDTDPGGRLPATLPASAAQLPTAGDPLGYPGVGEVVHYREGVFVGYRFYDAHRLTPAFPFGYGLSYTRFAFGGLSVRRRSATSFRVRFTVQDSGPRAGVAVPELYLHVPVPGEPPWRLVADARVSLVRGARRDVVVALDSGAFRVWLAGGWAVRPGCYTLALGASSRALGERVALPVAGGRCAAGRRGR